MIDSRLEARLQRDPDGDPRHDVGRVWARVAEAPIGPTARIRVSTLGQLGLAAVAAAFVVLAIALRPIPNGPATTPSIGPTPSSSIGPVLTTTQLQQILAAWHGVDIGDNPGLSLSVLGPDGHMVSWVEGAMPASPPESSTGRIGEISRLHVLSGAARVDRCSEVTLVSAACSIPPGGTYLSLDDPVAAWFPGWPVGDTTTVRQLLTGTSGLQAIATSLDDLTDRVALSPTADWSRATALAAAIAAPRRFLAGEQVAPVDTETILLEEILETATGQPIDAIVPVSGGFPPTTTHLADQPPVGLMPGRRTGGSAFRDLDPVVLALEGNAGGVSASSIDLAGFALWIWRPSELLDLQTTDILTDRPNGYRAPLGATTSCPCAPGKPIVLSAVGSGVGWSALMALDVTHQTAIGVVLDQEVDPVALANLLNRLVTALSA